MVAPFKSRPSPTSVARVIGSVFRTFDLAKPNPELAEHEVVNLLALAPSYAAIKPVHILEQYEKYKLTDAHILSIQTKCITMLLRHMMADDSLSPEEREQLKLFIKAIGIGGAKAMEICKAIGAQIYFGRLAEAMADGEISSSERAKLNNIKAIFALKSEVPPEGVDKKTAVQSLHRKYIDGLRTNEATAQKALAALDAAEEENPHLADLNDYITLRGIIDQFEGDMDAYAGDLQQFSEEVADLDPVDDDDSVDVDDIYESAQNTERCILESIATYKGHNLQQQMDRVRVWKTWTKKQIDKDNCGAYADRKALNSRLVKSRGFDPTGSPKQKAWAYDIIVEQCMATPFWDFTESKIAAAQTDDDLRYVRFMNWLKTKPAGWWINAFQETDLEGCFQKFLAADQPSR